MPKISNRGIQMPSSPIRKLVPFAEQAKSEGAHVYHLNIGQPDIKTPEIALAAVKNNNISILAYSRSEGSNQYRSKLADYYKANQIEVEANDIIVTTGGSEALQFVLGSIMDQEDEIIIPEPFYANYNGFSTAQGINVIPVVSKIENNFGIHISYRGNIIEFRGNQDACSSASKFISNVYNKLASGKKINGDIFDNFSKNSKESDAEDLNTILIKTKRKNIYPRSPNQLKFVNLIKDRDLVFGVGPAGTGKTYLAVACAVEALLKKEISKIILSRPAVEAGERLGFLPGDLKEKIDPYLRPLYDALNDLIPSKTLERYLENNIIEIAPLAFMRGRTLENSYIILDEAQNTSSMQMKMFLTRLGKNSKMVIVGDSTQIDLPRGEKSGLKEILNIMPKTNEIGKVLFKKSDITRHSLVTKIVEAYEKNNKALNKGE